MGNFLSQPEQVSSSIVQPATEMIFTALPAENEVCVTQSADIIIKCSLGRLVKGFFKEYVIVWHDPNSDSEENKGHRAQLEESYKVLTFTEWEKAKDYIQTTQAVCHVITSGTNGELLAKEICEKDNVCSIYVFCGNKKFHYETWASNFQKVACVENRIETVFNRVQKNVGEWMQKEDSLRLNLPAFAPIFNDGDKSKINHLHRFLKGMTNFNNREQAKNDFVNLSKGLFSQRGDINAIQNFAQNYTNYNKEQILKWYTRDSFLYRVINNSLRRATPDSIQYCRLVLKDIERAIKEEYQTKCKNFNGLLYRGAFLSEQEWLSLKENIGQEVEMHGFLSTSKEARNALNFVKSKQDKKIFITIIVPKGPNEEEQGFAEIEEFSFLPREKEVLFNVRSRFTVLELEDKYSQKLPYRHLVLLYGAQGFRKYAAEQYPSQKISILDIQNISCSHCKEKLSEMPENFCFVSIANSRKEVYYCKKCLDYDAGPFLCVPMADKTKNTFRTKVRGCLLVNANQTKTPFYGYECCNCLAKKQKSYSICTDCGPKEKKWCENCFDKNFGGCIEAGHNIVLETSPFSFWSERMSPDESNHLKFQNESVKRNNHIFQQAEMYFASHKFEEARQFYSLYIQKNEAKEGKDLDLATCYYNIADIYVDQGKYNQAREYYLKSLDIRKQICGNNSSSVAACYNGLGLINDRQGEFMTAHGYYSKALEIYKCIYGNNHLQTTPSLNNIGQVYQKQGAYKKALELFLQSLEIRKSVYGGNHPDIASSYSNIANVYCDQGKYKKAKESFLICLDIQTSVYGDNHPDIASSYNNIANVYCNQGKYKLATKYLLKCLNVQTSIYGENHPDIAPSLNNLGLVYQNQKKYAQALDYYLQSLDIDKSVYGETHSNIGTSYNNIATIYYDQGHLSEALEYLSKSLDISKSVHGDDHPSVATCYNNIACVYDGQGEREKALEYYWKSIEIRRSTYGEKHLDVATCYNNIANVYDAQGEHTKALTYFSKSLDSFKSVHGDNHPQVKIIRDRIAELSSPAQAQQQQ